MAKKRKRILFVDDSNAVHEYTRRIGHGHSQRHAYGPEQARKLIERRLEAVNRLIKRKTRQRFQEKNAAKKGAITKQIKFLGGLKTRPFDLAVLDINMPSGHPTGMQLLTELRREFPKVKVIMHSDDKARLEIAKGQGARVVERVAHFAEPDLKGAVAKELGIGKKIVSLEQLEKETNKRPKRESIDKLNFPSYPALVLANCFVTAKNKAERKEYKQILYEWVLVGNLSVKTFKDLLRTRWRPDLYDKAIHQSRTNETRGP